MAEKKKKVVTKQCARKGCRKRAKPGVGLCEAHEKEVNEAAYPIDGVIKISELRAYKFAALDAEMRNAQQGIRIIDLEMAQAQRQYEDAQRARIARRQAIEQDVSNKKEAYKQLVQTIADEFNLDVTKMSIDPDTCVVTDLRTT